MAGTSCQGRRRRGRRPTLLLPGVVVGGGGEPSYWRRRLPRRLASICGAFGLWATVLWWAFTGGHYIASLCGKDHHSWMPSMFFLTMIVLVWKQGTVLVSTALRQLPKLLYYLHVETWKLLIIDVVAKPVAWFSTAAMSVVLLNLALQQMPQPEEGVALRNPFSADSEGPVSLDAKALADFFCPLSRKILRALAASLTATTLFNLRTPPNASGSVAFRIVPLRRRSDDAPSCPTSPISPAPKPSKGIEMEDPLRMHPSLLLYKDKAPYEMPIAEIGDDGIPFWAFEDQKVIDEYTWKTPEVGDDEDDVVAWRLEGLPPHNRLNRRWHLIHETDRPYPEEVPQERGARIRRKFIAPDGSVSPDTTSWIGIYYRTLQNPQEDRDRYAMCLLMRRLLLPIVLLLGLVPWLRVFGIDLSSIVGLTSLTGVLAGAALSLAKSEVLENVFAGTLLSAQGSIISGDQIEIRYQVGNSQQRVSGVVCSVGSAYVFMRDTDGAILQVPNRKVLGAVIRTANGAQQMNAINAVRSRGGTALSYLSRQASIVVPREQASVFVPRE